MSFCCNGTQYDFCIIARHDLLERDMSLGHVQARYGGGGGDPNIGIGPCIYHCLLDTSCSKSCVYRKSGSSKKNGQNKLFSIWIVIRGGGQKGILAIYYLV